jgi:hypothetical protein
LPIAFQGVESERILVGIGAVNRVVVIQAVDARPGSVTRDDYSGIERRLVGDETGGSSRDGQKFGTCFPGTPLRQQVYNRDPGLMRIAFWGTAKGPARNSAHLRASF